MLCEEIMKREVECTGLNDSAQSAAQRMLEENIGFLPVCDQAKRAIGTITDRDIAVRLVARGLPASVKIADIMTREVVSCGPKDDVRKAERLMARNHKSRIVCLDDDGCLVGVISLSDIAEKDRDRAGQTLAEVSEREVHV
jgi:CBS-domain-containing membrane protein